MFAGRKRNMVLFLVAPLSLQPLYNIEGCFKLRLRSPINPWHTNLCNKQWSWNKVKQKYKTVKYIWLTQGTNARKVISEVYTFFVLQCTVFGRKSKHKTDVTAWHGIHFYKNNLWNILVIGNYYVNYQNYQN